MHTRTVPVGSHGASGSHRRTDAFRVAVRAAFKKRGDGLLSIIDAVLSNPEKVDCIAHLSLTPGARGLSHSGLYDALSNGEIDSDAVMHAAMTAVSDLGFPDVYFVDSTSWLRPAAATVDGRFMVHATTRLTTNGSPAGAGPSFEWICRQAFGAGSFVAPVDVRQVSLSENRPHQTAARIRAVADRHVGARPLFVLDAGYAAAFLTFDLRAHDTNADVLVRLHSNQVMRRRPVAPARLCGRPARHGTRFSFKDTTTWGAPDQSSCFEHPRFGTVSMRAWRDLHQHLDRDSRGMEHLSTFPIVDGWVVRVECSSPGKNVSMWLWWSGTGTPDLAHLFDCYTHRFDIEHFFKYVKNDLGFETVKPGTAAGHHRFALLTAIAYLHLVLLRDVVADRRLPWERIVDTATITPRRVRRVLSNSLHTWWHPPARSKPGRAGTGRARGSTNKTRTRHPIALRQRRPDGKAYRSPAQVARKLKS